MTRPGPLVAVTPPAFCNSRIMREELVRVFPNSLFNDRHRYLDECELIEFLRDADGALIGRDPINENVVKSLPRLRIISKYGVGLDTIDQEALERHKIFLGWTPGVNRLSVAELTLGFMIGLCHNAFYGGNALKEGDWQKEGGTLLTGKTVGIIGCGHVGKEVIRLLAPFECRFLVRDIVDQSDFCRKAGAVEVGFEELIERSDIVSLHVPLTRLTDRMIDAPVLGNMKRTAFLINTSRGEVVAQDELKSALREGLIAGAALDVFTKEPPEDAELLSLSNLMVTPHIGGNSKEAVEAMGRVAIGHLVKFFS